MAAAAAAPATPATGEGRSGGSSGPTGRPGSTGGCVGAAPRPASEIRFKEIAHYVGLSLMRNPSLTRGVPKALRSLENSASSADMLPATPSMDPPVDVLRELDLPSIHQHGKSERLKSQLEWLRAEQKAEREQLRKLENCLSDASLVEQRARQRLAKHRELHDLHAQRAAEVDRRIAELSSQLGAAESAPRRPPQQPTPQQEPPTDSQQRQLPTPWLVDSDFASREGGDRPRPATGLLAQSAERAAASHKPPSSAPGRQAGGLDLPAAQLDLTDPGPPRRPTAPGMSRSSSAPGTSISLGSPAGRARRPRAESPDPLDLPPPKPSPAEEAQLREWRRQCVREELKDKVGSAREAFRRLDLNGSGNISSQEFADGISRLGVDWQSLTGLRRPRDLFGLFDEDKDAVIVFKELFPEDYAEDVGRPSTPQFIRAYCDASARAPKAPRWSPAGPEEELRLAAEASQSNDDAAEKRKWMRSTMRRLKARGKSDARCREIVAAHLPRGTGPKDREGVSTFTLVDLKTCKKSYLDEVNLPMRRMWKVVGDLKDLRREQKNMYDKLYSVTYST